MNTLIPTRFTHIKNLCTVERAATIALFAFLVALAYPGIMTNDSFGWLIRARTGIFSDIQPLGATLLWQILDKIYPGPFLFVTLNIAMIFFSARYLFQRSLCYLQNPVWIAFFSLMLFSLWPPVVTISSIVWRDVTGLGISMMTVVAALLTMNVPTMTKHARNQLTVIILMLVFAGALCRYNHVAGVLPFVTLAFWDLFPLKCHWIWRFLTISAGSIVFCILATIFSMWITTSLSKGEASFASQPQDEYLLARLSLETSQNLFPSDLYPSMTQEKIKNAFDTHHDRTYAQVFWTAYSRENNPDLPRIRNAERSAKVQAALKTAITDHFYIYLKIRADEALRWFDPERSYRNGTLRTETADTSIFEDQIKIDFPTKKPAWATRILEKIDRLNAYSFINNPVCAMLLSFLAAIAAFFVLPRLQWTIISLLTISSFLHHLSVALNAYVANFRFIHQSTVFAMLAIIIFTVCVGARLAKRYIAQNCKINYK